MARYESHDLSFDVPRDWVDRSVVAYAAPLPPGHAIAPNVVMTRDQLGPGETLRAYADRQLVELARRLDGFKLGSRDERTFGASQAVELRFEWQSPSGPLDQRLLMIGVPGRAVLSLTATTPEEDAGRMVTAFDRIFASIDLPQTRQS